MQAIMEAQKDKMEINGEVALLRKRIQALWWNTEWVRVGKMSWKASSFWKMLEQDVVILVHAGVESPRPKDVALLGALQLKGDRGNRKSKIVSYVGILKELGVLV